MQIRPTASASGLIINFSIALFRVYTEFGIDSSKAKYLLFSCNESISRIAELCGYNDEKFFIRQFHDYVGLTPAKYRKALKK